MNVDISKRYTTSYEEELFWCVFGDPDLREYILKFHTDKWKKYKDWTDGDKAVEYSYIYMIQTHPSLTYTFNAMFKAAQSNHYAMMEWLYDHHRKHFDTNNMKYIHSELTYYKNYDAADYLNELYTRPICVCVIL